MTYAIRFSHTARRCSDVIVSSPGRDKFCKGGGGRTSGNDRREGPAPGPEGLEAISDADLDGADVVAPTEGAVAVVPFVGLNLRSWSEGRSRKSVCDIEGSGRGLELGGAGLRFRSRRSMREGCSCEDELRGGPSRTCSLRRGLGEGS
jgi:hypothetical protein